MTSFGGNLRRSDPRFVEGLFLEREILENSFSTVYFYLLFDQPKHCKETLSDKITHVATETEQSSVNFNAVSCIFYSRKPCVVPDPSNVQ